MMINGRSDTILASHKQCTRKVALYKNVLSKLALPLSSSLFPGLIFQLTDSALAVIDVVVMSLTRLVRNDSDDGDVLCSCKQGKGQVPKPVTAPSSNAAMTTNKVFEGIGDDDL